jgi:hypothetical protein
VFLVAGALAAIAPLRAEVSRLHPRIYVRHDEARVGKGIKVKQLRARVKDPAYMRWRAGGPGQGAAGTMERAARHLETGDPADLAAVREFLSTRTFSYEKNDVGGFIAGGEMAAAFDWVHSSLSEADRAAALANILTTAESSMRFLRRGAPDVNHNYTYMALNTVAICGLVMNGEPEPYGSKADEYLEAAKRIIESPGEVLDTWNAREGAWAEGSHYSFHETVRNMVMMLQAYRSATDTDYFQRVDMAKAGRFLIGSTRPDMTFERTGDTSWSRALASLTVPVTVEMLASGVPDNGEGARLRSFSDALLAAYGEKAVYPAFGWGMRMFHNVKAPRKPSYQTLPLAMRLGAGTYEQIVFRNGWTPESTMVTIVAGDHYTDHQHFDKGQFLIYRRGGLVVDSGAYDGMYKPETHANEYAPRTLAHNCLLVYDPNQQFPKSTNDGGQNMLRGKQHHRSWPMYLEHREKEGLHTAEVLAFDRDEANRYGYVRANLSKAYSEKVSFYDRQFVYLPGPDFLVVYDRVTAASPDFPKRWLLHFQERPEIDGKAPEPGVQTFPGARLTTARRSGEFAPGGQTFRYDGVLFAETLLPAQRNVIAVGGPGYEFYNTFTGKNYPVSRPATAPDVREAGTWRIEVAPTQPSKDDLFLHALQMANGAAARPVETRLVSTAQLAGVHFLSPGQNEVVLFSSNPAGGPVGLPVRYEISSPLPAAHLFVELPPGLEVVVEVNGKPGRPVRANAQGVLPFRDMVKGTRTVVIRAAH